jgi:hypothetical protein
MDRRSLGLFSCLQSVRDHPFCLSSVNVRLTRLSFLVYPHKKRP